MCVVDDVGCLRIVENAISGVVQATEKTFNIERLKGEMLDFVHRFCIV